MENNNVSDKDSQHDRQILNINKRANEVKQREGFHTLENDGFDRMEGIGSISSSDPWRRL
jgi:hypothetical protein